MRAAPPEVKASTRRALPDVTTHGATLIESRHRVAVVDGNWKRYSSLHVSLKLLGNPSIVHGFLATPFLLELTGSPVAFTNYQVPGLAGEQLPHLGGRAEQTQHAERSPLQACSLWENDHELRTVMRKL